MSNLKIWAAAAAMVALTGASQAALVSNPDGTVTDTNTNLIWLQNWRANDLFSWATQKAWAETTLDGFAGSNDWVLPSPSQFNGLFAAYGNLTLVSEFSNVVSAFYWSGADFAPALFAGTFRPDTGFQAAASKNTLLFAVAVRPGDVAASVPEPQTLALALLALGATVVARRRRPA